MINLPDAAKGRRYFLQFEGVATVAQVWVNGTSVGEHKGAFARFRFDITDQLKPGGANLIAVRADNSQPAAGSSTENVLPLGGDYFVYGGLYRGVVLVGTDNVQIDMLDHGGPGIYIRTPVVNSLRADVQVLTRLRNFTQRKHKLTLAATILDADGKAVASDAAPVVLGKGATAELRRTLSLSNPHLWQGRADPYLYKVAVDLRDGRNVLDRVIQPLGVRTFAFDANNGFILNGKAMPLHGVARHQDRAGKGWALSPEDHAEDMATLIEIGANTIRQAHYQHAQEWSDAADKAGMVVWGELPFTHQSSLTHDAPAQAVIENAGEQLTELIRQNYNHPSIVIWAVGNEIDIGALVAARLKMGGKGKRAQSLGMLKTLNALARQEDDSRPTVYADCCDGTEFALPGMEVLTGVTSVMAYNRYFGWYYGKPQDLAKELDKQHAAHPGIPIGVSEYGAGGAFSQHTDNPEGGPINSVGRPHPEEYQSWYHEKTWSILQARPYLAGTWLWNMFDFSARREEGDAFDLNDKGLVRYDHKARKDAFYFYKANWSSEPVLYITSRRYVNRAYPVIDIKVYSNAPQVSLAVNGKSLSEVQCPERICVSHDVQLQTGPNTVEASATIDGKVVTDKVTWNAPDPAAGLRILAGTLTGTTTSDGVRFGSDNFFVGGTPKSLTPFFVLDPKAKRVVSSTTTPQLYEAYREGAFRYELPLPDGKWNVTLHMFEPQQGKVGTRTFDVAAGATVVLHDFNPGAAAGGALKAVTRTFPVRVNHGRLDLEFTPKGGDALVSAIVVNR
jgi:beta-galactosidase